MTPPDDHTRTPTSAGIEAFWAKTDADGFPARSIRDHSIHAGCVAKGLLDLLPHVLQDLIPKGIVPLIALHDLGKVSPGFQSKCEWWRRLHGSPELDTVWRQRESSHAKVSQAILGHWLGKAFAGYAIVAGGHHGRFATGGHKPPIGQGGRGLLIELTDTKFQSVRDELRRIIEEVFEESLPSEPLDDRDPALIVFLTGLTTLADWIASDEAFFPIDPSTFVTPLPAEDVVAQGARMSVVALRRLGWGGTEIAAGKSFRELFPSLPRPNRVQETLWGLTERPGLFIVEAPMGCGKTEAALGAAYRRWADPDSERGLYFALPTQLTSDRVFTRLNDFLQRALVRPELSTLVHGDAWLREDRVLRVRPASPQRGDPNDEAPVDFARDARQWFASSRKALLAPFGAGTVDQALLGVLPAKHCGLRTFGLAGKVVVIDEVHSYDSYTGTLVNSLVRDLIRLRATIIVLSATLTGRTKRELLESAGVAPSRCPAFSQSDPYPMITSVTRRRDGGGEVSTVPVSWDGALRRVQLHHRRDTDPTVWNEALTAAESGACVLILRNTVASAQATWRCLRSAGREGGPPVGLLHSRFPRWRRRELEDRWMQALGKGGARPNGCLLVATQVVEQSVDIDADLLITDLAPTDLLFQRLGRLHRHDLERPDGFRHARAVILHPDLSQASDAAELKRAMGPSAWVYPPYLLWRTHHHWISRPHVELPGDIRPWLEATYAESPGDEGEVIAAVRAERDRLMERQQGMAQSRARRFDVHGESDEEGFFTRWNNQRSADLVLLRSVPAPVPGNRDWTLVPIEGTEVVVPGYAWSFVAARALHLNVVRVPWYAVREWFPGNPEWLGEYLENGVLGVVDGSNRIVPLSSVETPSGLRWCPDSGVSIERARPPEVGIQAKDDHEDGWW